jgi:hypothetical protein
MVGTGLLGWERLRVTQKLHFGYGKRPARGINVTSNREYEGLKNIFKLFTDQTLK